jgi:hypothetical protein
MSLIPALGTLLWLFLQRPITTLAPEPEAQPSARA